MLALRALKKDCLLGVGCLVRWIDEEGQPTQAVMAKRNLIILPGHQIARVGGVRMNLRKPNRLTA